MELTRRAAIVTAIALLLPACASTMRPGATAGALPGAVAAPEPHAAREGASVLREGGNAFDAAVTIGFVLAVTHPEAGNLGGGGFLLAHRPGEEFVIDAREVAPLAATRDMYLDAQGVLRPDASLVGPLASGVPGSVAGYLRLHERCGTLPRGRLLAPAIRLAEEGFLVDKGLAASLERNRHLLSKFEATRRVFFREGRPLRQGERLRQPELAGALKAISSEGADGFYRGAVAQAIVDASAAHGGNLTLADLAAYRPREREVLRGRFAGHEVLTMPPPSSGGVLLLQILSMLERAGYGGMRPVQRHHLFAEASRRAFADRATHFGDPDFVDVPVDALLDPGYLEERLASIDITRATPSSGIEGRVLPAEGEQTCHFSVVDRTGNALSCTTTLNGAYGCGLVAHGVLLNNEMDDFAAKPGVPNQFGLVQGGKNAVEPGKRPLSSMTPTILLRDGQPVLVLGSPGGPTIISVVAQVLANRLLLGMDLVAAVRAPRLHNQWLPDEILHEGLPPDDARALERLGHRLRRKAGPMGDVQAVGLGEGAVSDPRGRGAALPDPENRE